VSFDQLKADIEQYAATPAGQPVHPNAKVTVARLLDALEAGEVRAAVNNGGRWEPTPWVKRGILLGFRVGDVIGMGGETLQFVDKDTYPARIFDRSMGVRIVPG